MTLNKLTDTVQFSDELNKINEIIDELNNNPSITVDSELSETSENPVQNKVITAALQTKQDTLTAGVGISISEEGIISSLGGTAEWGAITGELSEQTDLMALLDEKQNTLTAGVGISISDEGVISNTQTSAEWGNISGTLSEQTDLIEVLDTKQDVLTAGTNISISEEGEISAADTSWGNLQGVITDQTDLTTLLDLKQDYLIAGTGISISEEGVISSYGDSTSFTALCPNLTPIDGEVEWTITHNLGTRNVSCNLYYGNNEISKKVTIDSENTLTVTFKDNEAISAGDYKVVILAKGGTVGGTDLIEVEDKLPLFFSTWSPIKMSENWIKADGTYLSRTDYPKQYAYLMKVKNNVIQNTGLSVKLSTETYDDYDFVINTTNQTFRLPLLNGEEDKIKDIGTEVDIYNVASSWNSPTIWNAPYNCIYVLEINPSNSSPMLYLGKASGAYGQFFTKGEGNRIKGIVYLNKGESLYGAGANIESKFSEKLFKLKGNGNLYFLINNETQSSGSSSVTDPNFIPKDTVIHVELDGSGDFTTIADAVNYLSGKWSNGEVTILIGEGTFTLGDSLVSLATNTFNFSRLCFKGVSKTNSIIYRNEWSSKYSNVISVRYPNVPVLIANLTVKGVRDDGNISGTGIWICDGAVCSIKDVIVKDCSQGIRAYDGGRTILYANITIDNARAGLSSQGGYLSTNLGTTVSISNATYVCEVTECGIMQLARTTITKSNVTNEFNISVNTITSNGVIYRG